MLKVDLGQLARKKRLLFDASVPPHDALFHGAVFEMRSPLDVQLEVQQAGHDVVVRGRIEGEAELACRRCLTAVAAPIDEELALLYREGISEAEAEASEIYALPAKAHEIDL